MKSIIFMGVLAVLAWATLPAVEGEYRQAFVQFLPLIIGAAQAAVSAYQGYANRKTAKEGQEMGFEQFMKKLLAADPMYFQKKLFEGQKKLSMAKSRKNKEGVSLYDRYSQDQRDVLSQGAQSQSYYLGQAQNQHGQNQFTAPAPGSLAKPMQPMQPMQPTKPPNKIPQPGFTDPWGA